MSDRARLRTARRNLKEFVKAMCSELPKTEPADRYVRTALGKLYVADMQILLRAEKTHRASIRYLSEKVRQLQKDAERLERLAVSVPALRRLVEERGRKIRALTAERDALQRALDNLRSSVRKGVPEERAQWNAACKELAAAVAALSKAAEALDA